MSSFRLTLPVSSTCGRCGYSACTCFAPTEYPPFCTGFGSLYPRVIRDDEEDNGRGYGGFTNRFRSEVDGLQAGVEYLDTLEDPAGGAPLLSQIRRKSLKELLKLEEQRKSFIEEESEEGARRRERFEKEKAAQKLAAHNAPTSPYSTTPEGRVGFGLHDSYTDQFFQDGTVPSFVGADNDSLDGRSNLIMQEPNGMMKAMNGQSCQPFFPRTFSLHQAQPKGSRLELHTGQFRHTYTRRKVTGASSIQGARNYLQSIRFR